MQSAFIVDALLTELVNEAAGGHPWIDQAMAWVSALAVPAMVATVALQWWASGEREVRRHAIVSAGLAFLAGLALNQAIILEMHRLRPYEVGVSHLIVAPSGDPSFPSDHATAAFAIAFAFLLCGRSRSGSVYAFLAVVVCWSRVYVGTHYMSDVAGGALTGLMAAMAIALSYRRQSWIDRRLTAIF
jgi:undecaprenyl-diphosphatase